MADQIAPCKVDGCELPGEWQVLRSRQHTPPHGFTHSGDTFALYRINHVRQAEYCLGHGRLMVMARNRELARAARLGVTL